MTGPRTYNPGSFTARYLVALQVFGCGLRFGLNAKGTPFVWDGTKAVNYQDPSWLTKLIG